MELSQLSTSGSAESGPVAAEFLPEVSNDGSVSGSHLPEERASGQGLLGAPAEKTRSIRLVFPCLSLTMTLIRPRAIERGASRTSS